MNAVTPAAARFAITALLSVPTALLAAPAGQVSPGTGSAAASSGLPVSIRITSPLGRTGVEGRIRFVARVISAPSVTLGAVRFLMNGTSVGEDVDGAPHAIDWIDENPFDRTVLSVEVSDEAGTVYGDSVVLEPYEIIEESQVASVLVDASVRNAAGRMVGGLGVADFSLTEDGAPQQLDLVQQVDLPTTIALLVDSSQSMSRRMDFVRLAAGRLSEIVRPADRVIVVPFSFEPQAVTGPTADRATIIGAIGAVQASVFVVAIGGVAGISLRGERLLRRIASETGGRAFFPPRENSLAPVAETLTEDIENRYLLTYTPANQTADGAFRRIAVQARGTGLTVLARAGYFAPKPPPVRPSIEFTVTDADVGYVDVSADDLVVTEDGVEQKIESFQEAVTPVSIVLALEASGSMRRAASAAVSAARYFVEALRPEDALAVVLFADRPVFAQDLSTTRESSLEAIGEYQAAGGTALYDAVDDSLSRLERVAGRRAVVVVTDGRDEDNPGTGPGSTSTLDEVLARQRTSGAMIFGIGLGSNVGRGTLETLAAQSGGQAYFPQDVETLPADYARIVEDLRRRFVVSYTSTNPARDGAWRTVEIRTRESNQFVRSAGGYFAPAR